jgi:dihydroxyacetone kinase-like predicted kinase
MSIFNGTFASLKAVSDELMFMGSKYSSDAASGTDPAGSLADLTGSVTEIDGTHFGTLYVAGYALLANNKDELNRINVFPVPDADTGNNMKIALRGAALDLLYEPKAHLQEAAELAASAVLLSGQGNSGTVLSFFYVNLAAELKKLGGKEKVSVAEFAGCIQRVGAVIGDSFPANTAKEGTIVSVARKGVAGLGDSPHADLKAMLTQWESQSRKSLYETPDELEVDGKFVLKDAGVDCDSGAKGFWYMIEGMKAATSTAVTLEGVLGKEGLESVVEPEAAAAHDCEEKHQYCTECVIVLKKGSSQADVEAALADPALGDSKVIVCGPCAKEHQEVGESMCKVHIHSDAPDEVFKAMQSFNALDVPLKEKVGTLFRSGRCSPCFWLYGACVCVRGMCVWGGGCGGGACVCVCTCVCGGGWGAGARLNLECSPSQYWHPFIASSLHLSSFIADG